MAYNISNITTTVFPSPQSHAPSAVPPDSGRILSAEVRILVRAADCLSHIQQVNLRAVFYEHPGHHEPVGLSILEN